MAAAQLASSLGTVVNATSNYLQGAGSVDGALKAAYMPHHLYAGHDWNALSLPEQWWARWYM